MKSTIITIVLTSVLTSLLTVVGMAIVIPRVIKIPEIPKFDMAKTEMPDFNSIMSSQMDGIVAKITEKMPQIPTGVSTTGMPAGLTAPAGVVTGPPAGVLTGPPAGVLTGPPAGITTASKDMAANVKKMKKAVKDMEMWAGKMKESGDVLDATYTKMNGLFGSQLFMGTINNLIGFASSGGACACSH